MDCHGAKKAKAKVRFDNIDPDIISGNSSTMWHDTYETFNLGEMPPEDEKQPTPQEREVPLLCGACGSRGRKSLSLSLCR